MHISTVGNGHQADRACFLIHGINDANAANAIRS